MNDNQIVRLPLSSEPAPPELVLGPGLLARAADLLAGYGTRRLLLVSDAHVVPLYAAPLRDRLAQAGYQIHLLEIPPGEEAKTLDVLTDLYGACHDLQVEREDVVLAVGGGTVGDVAGMLAGTYLRGLDFIQVPTTLVAQVTASIGGKAGVNFRGDKNLIGLFKQPALVLADLDTLKTLSADEFRSGLGELITVGVLGAPELFEALETHGTADLGARIVAAVECKRRIVEADPFDRLGIRARLNLGHTFGHALEKLSAFTLPHGLAVAIGLHIACRLAAALGLCSPELCERVRRALLALGLPLTIGEYTAEQMIVAMRGDKKRSEGRLRWVLPVALGQVVLVGEEEVPRTLLVTVLEELRDHA